jgi:pimeloyl-ACP methyl ester carboxylesterase
MVVAGLVGWLILPHHSGSQQTSSRKLIPVEQSNVLHRPTLEDSIMPISKDAAGKEQQAHLREAYGKLPLSFEANKGQTDSRVKFLSRGSGYSLFLTSNEAVLALSWRADHSVLNTPRLSHEPTDTRKAKQGRSMLRMGLVGANPASQVEGQEELPGKSNYFIGNDPAKWRTNVAHFARVQYKDIYPGVNLFYYGSQHDLEYDFMVAPGASPGQIKMRYSGAKQILIDKRNGDLVLKTDRGEVRHRKPIVYQEQDGGTRRQIDADYLILHGEVSFKIDSYDPTRPLVIDPTLVYSTYLGGGSDDYAYGLALDTQGNVYVSGETFSTNFPLVNGTQVTNAGNNDAFVSKLSASGTQLLYSTYIGGASVDTSTSIAVDTQGSAYITGRTQSLNFPIKNALQPTYGGAFADAFVTKLNPTGSQLVYSTYLGGGSAGCACNAEEAASGIAVDTQGNAYVVGHTQSADFPVRNPFQFRLSTRDDGFISKLNSEGSQLVYSTYFPAIISAVAVNGAGELYLTGTAYGNLPVQNPAQPTIGGDADAFISKLNTSGGQLLYSTYLGGTSLDYGTAIAIDAQGSGYVTGVTYSTDFPTRNAVQAKNRGFRNGFVTKLNDAGDQFLYSTYLGGSSYESTHGIAVDSLGSAYITGETTSTDFPVLNALQPSHAGGYTDAFVVKLNATGNQFLYSTYIGGDTGNVLRYEYTYGIAVDANGNAFTTGSTAAAGFPIKNALQPTLGGGQDAFVLKINDAASTPQQRPLIFIPGIAGSRLDTSDHVKIWPPLEETGFANPLSATGYIRISLDPNPLFSTPNIIVPDVIRFYDEASKPEDRDVYNSVLTALNNPSNGGYHEYIVDEKPARRTFDGCDLSQQSRNPNLFVFAYDWRKSDIEAAAALKDYVRCVQRFYPNTDIDIVAHSQGGLVARRYILDNAADHHVKKLITIATPWLGAPKAINVLKRGRFLDPSSVIKDPIKNSIFKTLSEYYPGVHELVPSKAYFDLVGQASPYRYNGQALTYDQATSLLDQQFPVSKPGTANRAFHGRSGEDNWSQDASGVEYHHLYGIDTQADTIGTVAQQNISILTPDFGSITQTIFDIVLITGDGTVPVISARRNDSLNAPGVSVSSGRIKGFYCINLCNKQINPVDHTGLMRNPAVIAEILRILQTPSQAQTQEQPIGTTITADPPDPDVQSAYYLRIIGAAAATVLDGAGNSTNPLSDPPDNSVPTVTSYLIGDKSFLSILPMDQQYTVRLRADINPMIIELTQGTDTVTTQAIRYKDLSLPAGVTARIQITPQGVGALQYDRDGDGIFETTVAPTVATSGSAAQDTDPPTVSITESRQQTGTLITVTATDSGSGVKAVYYSLDGTQFQSYTQPFTVDPYRTPTVYAFADDNVANRSSLTTFQLTAPASTLQFNAATYSVNEGGVRATITVTRAGDTSETATVDYATVDNPAAIRCDDTTTLPGVAFARCDYATSIDTLTFAPGETQKTFTIPIIDDSHVEGAETVQIRLSNATGATLGAQSTATLTIIDNDSAAGANPIFGTDFFVRMQYLDFLSREPEPGQPWSGVLNGCAANDPACDRVSVSANFFRSDEFQLKGLFVFRFYKVSFGRISTYAEIVSDMRSVTGPTTAELLAKKSAFASAWVQRQEFKSTYDAMSNAAFVNALMNRYSLQQITTPNPSTPDDTSQAAKVTLTRADLVNRLNGSGGTLSRSQIVRAIADSNEVGAAEFNPAFVAMQYFGYLRRDPEAGGYNAWLQTINANPADFRAMVNGFMNSTEYRLRFGRTP